MLIIRRYSGTGNVRRAFEYGRTRALPLPSRLPSVRDAEPSAMRHPPSQWDRVDERGDESFPASDPPGTY